MRTGYGIACTHVINTNVQRVLVLSVYVTIRWSYMYKPTLPDTWESCENILSCLESPVLYFNNVKVRCVGKDEYVYDSYVRNR